MDPFGRFRLWRDEQRRIAEVRRLRRRERWETFRRRCRVAMLLVAAVPVGVVGTLAAICWFSVPSGPLDVPRRLTPAPAAGADLSQRPIVAPIAPAGAGAAAEQQTLPLGVGDSGRVRVKGYTRQDGTVVAPYTRKKPAKP